MSGFLDMFHFAVGAGCNTNTGRLPSLYKGLECVNGNLAIKGLDDVFIIIGNVIQILLAVAGSIAIVAILLSAAFYIISAGDPGRVKRAKDILTQAVIGLVIIICSYTAIEFIARGF